MSRSVQFVAVTALLGLALSGSAQASLGFGPYAYAAASDVDNLYSPVEDMTFDGSTTGVALYWNSWAQTEMGVHHVVATGNESGTMFGAVSAWADAFTLSGGNGFGVANVSLSVDGVFRAAPYSAAGYMLLKAASPVMPWDLQYYLESGVLPTGVETVMFDFADSGSSAGPVHSVLTGSFDYEYGSTFYLTSVFGAVASGIGSADFGNTATFGISAVGDIATGSGATYLTAAVPEPETWAMLLAGIGLIGLQAKRRRSPVKALSA